MNMTEYALDRVWVRYLVDGESYVADVQVDVEDVDVGVQGEDINGVVQTTWEVIACPLVVHDHAIEDGSVVPVVSM